MQTIIRKPIAEKALHLYVCPNYMVLAHDEPLQSQNATVCLFALSCVLVYLLCFVCKCSRWYIQLFWTITWQDVATTQMYTFKNRSNSHNPPHLTFNCDRCQELFALFLYTPIEKTMATVSHIHTLTCWYIVNEQR